MREVRDDLARRLDEVDAVIVVFLDAGGDGEDVRVEDDVFGRKARLFGQQLVGAGADFHLARLRIRLPLFVEGHHDDGSAIGAHQLGMMQECLLALFKRYRIDQRLALHAFQARFDDLPLGLSIMTGTREMSGSAAMRLRYSIIACLESMRPSSMLMSMICAPFST